MQPWCSECDSRWQFECETSKKCIPREWQCNNVTDCEDGSDEHCECGDGEFQCDDGTCIIERYFCDGKPDCRLGEDEIQGCGEYTLSLSSFKTKA